MSHVILEAHLHLKIVIYLKFPFNWVFCIFAGRPTQKGNEDNIVHFPVLLCETR